MESLRTENNWYGHQDFNRDCVEKEKWSFWNRDKDKENEKEKEWEREREKVRERDGRGDHCRDSHRDEDPQPELTQMISEIETHSR